MWKSRKVARNMLFAVALATIPAVVLAQDIRQNLFGKTDQLVTEAKKQLADVLAPDNFSKGMRAYAQADSNFKKGKNINSIQKELNKTNAHMKKALEVVKLAKVTFSSSIKARSDANKAGGPQYATELWQEAERLFKEATGELEDGDVKGAQKRSIAAEKAYRDAELNAVKGNYLNETRRLLAKADKMKVENYAPKTLAKATRLLTKAEQELNRNRYDTDLPRDLARQAKYEAKHAIYLSGLLQKVKTKKMSMEDLVLNYEQPLIKIAASADLVAELDRGHAPLTKQLTNHIITTQAELDRLKQDVASMESKLGGLSSESKILKQQQKIRMKVASIEKMFSRSEAEVLRNGDNIILRMIGLNFASGKSEIQAKNFSLLSKVKNTIKVFPKSNIIVEGHTDSYGGDAANMNLSQKRAESVRGYIIENMNIKPNAIKAIGYGEERPVARNETPEGRRKNRRIDIVLKI